MNLLMCVKSQLPCNALPLGSEGMVQALALSIGACVSLGIAASLSRCPAPVAWVPRTEVQGHSL